mmetsp:Transcript_8352/g.25104  ORF Transcript_8352/g.25104 Transcript_8352/m.25104 type:complete len:186 (-) Transcript_8352:161-718(-)|eukprot:CAMPEP_0198725238 /NCGR_PEP_ID=MMETSP1475-20131203/2588_1 /TAXON_ID= ORGANISM="Unidentified sp., Strain CCMP1999" /NCGR_SAMPLE_ID=MMETSP1475 /ASSEMBLY_ACC=CAM_ASM_001111 /LENGTH=185 /DNA_ID=CAMNT_0044486981 /DNA_START=212 /DNA_END=769 /DNA_ORIENTATION=-
MVLVLLIGDLHVPHRSPVFPSRFKSLLAPGKVQYIFCTGNLCTKEMEEYLKSLCNEVHIAQGDMDENQYQDVIVVNIGPASFGICHGHQLVPWFDVAAQFALQRDLGVDVLVVGHSHQLATHENPTGGIVLNPGTATGAPRVTDKTAPEPSFVLMDIQGTRLVTYTYVLVGEDNVKVDRNVVQLR